MGMVVRTNTMALNAYRQLGMNNNAVAKSLEKLASGYRINRAGDDAAGLAISEKMKAQIKGLETASSNAQDGISLIQTAEGALTEVHSMLNRMVELATKSANGTYSSTEREALQAEVDSLLEEIDRIAQSTNFNGINLLDGTMEAKTAITGVTNVDVTHVKDGQMSGTEQKGVFKLDLSKQKWTNAGADDVDDVNVKLGGQALLQTAATVGKDGGTLSGVEFAEAFMKEIEATNTWEDADGAVYDVTHDGNGVLTFTQQVAADLNKTALDAVVEGGAQDNHGNAAAVTVVTEGVSAAGRVFAQGTFELKDIEDGTTITIGDETYTFAVGDKSQFKGGSNVVDLTDLSKDATNLATEAAQRLSKVADGNKSFLVETDAKTATIFLTEKEGGVDYSKNNLAGKDGIAYQADGTASKDATTADWKGLVSMGKVDTANSQKGLVLQIGDTGADYNMMTVNIADMGTKGLGVNGLDITSADSARGAIDTIKAAINSVSSTRADMGALQNRLEYTINNLDVAVENLSAANSRIRDTDMAKEMMNYTKMNVLVQSAQAMLAQANQQPQSVLQLLQ